MKIILTTITLLSIVVLLYLKTTDMTPEKAQTQVLKEDSSTKQQTLEEKITVSKVEHQNSLPQQIKTQQKNETASISRHKNYLEYRENTHSNNRNMTNHYLNQQHQLKLFRKGGIKGEFKQRKIQDHQKYAKQHQSQATLHKGYQENNFMKQKTLIQERRENMQRLQIKQMSQRKYSEGL